MFASGSARGAGARLLSSACIIALASAPCAARAQAVGQKASVAEALFQEGKKRLDEKKIPEACIKFADSQREDPALGTLLYLADCHEKEGKTASAWAEFTDAAAQAHGRNERDREKFANDHAAALEKKIHRVQLDAAEKPEGLAITLDNEPFGTGGLGTAIPLDPGEHVVVVSATGKKKWSTKVTVAASPGLDRVTIPALENEPVPIAPVAATVKPGGAPSNAEVTTPPDTTKRTIGIVVGVAGLGLLGLATYYQLTALSRDKDSTDERTFDLAARTTLHDQAKSAQTFALVSGGAGIVAVGVGIFLIATSGGSTAPAKAASVRVLPMASANAGGLSVAGTW